MLKAKSHMATGMYLKSNGTKMIIAAGGKDSTGTILNEVDLYNIETDTWTTNPINYLLQGPRYFVQNSIVFENRSSLY